MPGFGDLFVLKDHSPEDLMAGTYVQKWRFPKIGGFPPKSSLFNRVFHYFHHPFWGPTPIFGNTPNGGLFGFSWICSFFSWVMAVGEPAINPPGCKIHYTSRGRDWYHLTESEILFHGS